MKIPFTITVATLFAAILLFVAARNPLSPDTFRQRYHTPTFLEQPNITGKQVERYILQHVKFGTPKAQVRSWLKSQYVDFTEHSPHQGYSLFSVRGIQLDFDEHDRLSGICVPTMSSNTCIV